MEKMKVEIDAKKRKASGNENNEYKQTSSVELEKRSGYSDEDLKEFKKLILSKLENSKADYELLKGTLALKGDNGTNDTSASFKLAEDGADAAAKEETANQAIRLQKYIEHLNNALIRIENRTYGICSMTGQVISKERLRSVPHSTLSINAKLGIGNK